MTQDFPGSMMDDIRSMQMPYCIYANPYTGYFYAADAGGFVEAGTLYQWNPQGELLSKNEIYINPGHMLALPPDGHLNALEGIEADRTQSSTDFYNLQGIRVTNPRHGQLYIVNGKKIIYK
ncbi:MAG: hypothetical protein Q4C34_04090 [Bacteroidales bacterium]|nr:hypothetical protein [Bacteroidales bacterium]